MPTKKIQRAFLITGFNNWGKSTLISELFKDAKTGRPRHKFYSDIAYSVFGTNNRFVVQSQSNDDVHTRYIEQIKSKAKKPHDLLGAFCPAKEDSTNALKILEDPVFKKFDEIHMILLKHKWDGHAELKIDNIQSHFRAIKNVSIVVIDNTDPDKWAADIVHEIKKIYGS